MDVYRFLNSKDVAEHLQSLGHEFNAAEAAYVVYHCETATIAEKTAAWQEIIDAMPDCAPVPSGPGCRYASIHELLQDVIRLQATRLETFEEHANASFYLSKGHIPGYGWHDLGRWAIFTMLDKCLESLRDEQGLDTCDRYRICKLNLDVPGYVSKTFESQLVVNRQLEPMSIRLNRGVIGGDGSNADRQLRHGFIDLPVPFEIGDIVLDPTAENTAPFVLDRLSFWNSTACCEHGITLSREMGAEIDRSIALWQKYAVGSLLMRPTGYELVRGMVKYNFFGSCANYLNLERFGGELTGELKLLGAFSKYLKGEYNVIDLVNDSRIIGLECELSRLRAERERGAQLFYKGSKYLGTASFLHLQELMLRDNRDS